MANYDIIGNIAIVKFTRGEKAKEKKRIAELLLRRNKNIRTVLEKAGKFSGRLRTQKTKYIAGEKAKEALYKENNCEFLLNVETCYFSPRLASERKEIAEKVKKNEYVLVMFGGVAPFAVVIAKLKKANRIVSVELGKDCCKYAVENARRNKVNVEVIQGDVRRVLHTHLSAVKSTGSSSLAEQQRLSSLRKKVPKLKNKFDRIVMARPNLEDSFLDVAFKKIKRDGIIHYYGFYHEEDVEGKENKLKKLIEDEAKKAKKKIKILKIKKAGDIGKHKYRYRADILVN